MFFITTIVILFILKIRLSIHWQMSSSSPMSPDYGGGGGVAKTVSMFSKLLNHGSALVVEGVKNFVLKENVSCMQ